METRNIRTPKYLGSWVWCKSWEAEIKIANVRLRPSSIRELQLVGRGIARTRSTCKNSQRATFWEKAAKKTHNAGHCELHKTKFKQLIADAYMRFQEIQSSSLCTLSNNWKWQFAMNQNSDSKFHTQVPSRIRKEHASWNREALTHSPDDWWKAN